MAVTRWVGVDDPFADVEIRDRHRSAHRVTDSGELGWRSVRASTWCDNAIATDFDMPVSRSHRLVLVTDGRYVIESRDGPRWRRALYGPGSLGLTAAGNPSTLRWRSASPEALRSLHVYLDADVLDEAQREFGRLGSHGFPDALELADHRVVAAVQEIGWALEHGAPALHADAAAHVLAARLVTCVAGAGQQRRPAGLGSATLARVVEYMATHLAEPISLADLGAVANLSKHHLLRQFRAATGVPPHRYLRQMRMQRAERLLRHGGPTVRAVAQACGYASERQFAAAFTRHSGISPSRYRAQTSNTATTGR